MLNYYQHLPEMINPIVFSIDFFSLRWYSLMYILGFVIVHYLLVYRIKKGEFDLDGNKKSIIKNKNDREKSKSLILDFLLYSVAGLLIGARLGYIIFYNPAHYLHNPWEIILPISVTSYGLQITGISGMSYHGGLVGVIVAGIIFTKKRLINFWKLADFVAPAIPAGYFFGRLGNFLNGELYGRATSVLWGMYFPSDTLGLLRHPSQLYEAFLEGLILFILLWAWRNRLKSPGQILFLYMIGYGTFRFFIEFFREPDPQIGFLLGRLTLGQILSIIMLISAIYCFCYCKKWENRVH